MKKFKYLELDKDTRVSLVKLVLEGKSEVLNTFIGLFDDVIHSVIEKYINAGLEYSELYNEGVLAIYDVISLFKDNDYFVPDSFYEIAKHFIERRITMFISSRNSCVSGEYIYLRNDIEEFKESFYSKHGFYPSNEFIADEFYVPVDVIDKMIKINEFENVALALDEDAIPVDEVVQKQMMIDALNKALNSLCEEDRNVIKKMYFNNNPQEKFGYTQNQKDCAMRRLKRRMYSWK